MTEKPEAGFHSLAGKRGIKDKSKAESWLIGEDNTIAHRLGQIQGGVLVHLHPF